jgi:hypothetical protein
VRRPWRGGPAGGKDLVDAGEETGPAGTSGRVAGGLRRAGRRVVRGLLAFLLGVAEGDDAGAQPGVGGGDAVIAVGGRRGVAE